MASCVQDGRQRKTGAFQQLPHIPLADDHLRTACNRANRIQPNQKLKNKFANAKNLAARRLDALAKELTVPLGKMLSSFPVEGSMHPFEIALLDLTIGLDSYSKRLKKMDNLRRSCLEVGSHFVNHHSCPIHSALALILRMSSIQSSLRDAMHDIYLSACPVQSLDCAEFKCLRVAKRCEALRYASAPSESAKV